ncbi:hypothetical protein SLEP1_g40182 [Rubroshorea leprosula]|uniref:Uncharacterized protein n=1 Tax=Rubroshorea leprosula TaxID=152421 RepID=A0AAV5L3G9_9ROSI|nr:hypothetical protein SLEP1_g40182 [Rubroshorea leprosula]
MADAPCATVGLPPKCSVSPLLLPRASAKFPSKLTKRKNFLRPKILRTLTKPFPSSPTNPLTPVVSPERKPEDATDSEPVSDQIPGEIVEEANEVEEFQVSEISAVAGENNGSFGMFSAKSVLKFGFYFIGVFILQTIFAALLMGNANTEQKDSDLGSSERNKRRGKYVLDKNGKFGSNSSNVIYLDEPELEGKIEEIRAMAREAREARKAEQKELKGSNEEGDIVDEALNFKERAGIQREIDARLDRLEKRLNSKREKLPGSYLSSLDRLNNGEDAETEEMNTRLMVKKKFKFKDPDMNSGNNVKGFPGSEDGKMSKCRKSGSIARITSGTVEVDWIKEEAGQGKAGAKAASENLSSLQSDGDKTEKREKKTGAAANRFGTVQESSQGSSSTKGMDSRKLSDLGIQNPKDFTQENLDAGKKSDKHTLRVTNGHAKQQREVGKKPPAKKFEDRPSDNKKDLWWLNLRYVFAILMRGVLDGEETKGLYTLRSTSQVQDESKSPLTVAFEDRGDADNFRYLLESFFEDLGDFTADVVPLSVKELHEVVGVHPKNVIVVKKGQLKLYAGQPIAEVENALYTLVAENQGTA